MSETATVHVREVKVVKEGTNAKGKWTMYGLKDGNDDLFSWFNNRTLYDEAKGFEDKRAEIEFEVNDKGKNLKAIKDVAPANGDTPPLGTGEYVTGQKPPIEVRRIYASTAWNCAARMAQADLGYEAAKHIADKIFADLLKKGQALEDGDIPF